LNLICENLREKLDLGTEKRAGINGRKAESKELRMNFNGEYKLQALSKFG